MSFRLSEKTCLKKLRWDTIISTDREKAFDKIVLGFCFFLYFVLFVFIVFVVFGWGFIDTAITCKFSKPYLHMYVEQIVLTLFNHEPLWCLSYSQILEILTDERTENGRSQRNRNFAMSLCPRNAREATPMKSYQHDCLSMI